MKLGFGTGLLPAALAACALVTAVPALAQGPAGTDATTTVIPQIGGADADSAVRGVWIEPGEQVYRLGPDSPAKVSSVTFTGATVFDGDYLSKAILSRETHWYHILSRDWMFFHGPAQSRALLEVKGCGAEVDFGFASQPPCFRSAPWQLKDFVAVKDFRLSSEDLYNPDLPGVQDVPGVDRELILRNYWARGYMDAEVTPQARKDADGTGIALTYVISEGERYRFGVVKLTTDIKGFDPEDLRYAIDVTPGDWYHNDAATDIADRLDSVKFSSVSLFNALGGHLPFNVCVEPEALIDRAGRRVDLNFEIARCPDTGGRQAGVAEAAPGAAPARRIGVAGGRPAVTPKVAVGSPTAMVAAAP